MVNDRASGSVGARNLWPLSAALEGGAPRLRSRAAGRDEDSKNPRVSAPILSEATEKGLSILEGAPFKSDIVHIDSCDRLFFSFLYCKIILICYLCTIKLPYIMTFPENG